MLLNNLKETKLKIYKSVFVGAVVSSQLFKHRGEEREGRVRVEVRGRDGICGCYGGKEGGGEGGDIECCGVQSAQG